MKQSARVQEQGAGHAAPLTPKKSDSCHATRPTNSQMARRLNGMAFTSDCSSCGALNSPYCGWPAAADAEPAACAWLLGSPDGAEGSKPLNDALAGRRVQPRWRRRQQGPRPDEHGPGWCDA